MRKKWPVFGVFALCFGLAIGIVTIFPGQVRPQVVHSAKAQAVEPADAPAALPASLNEEADTASPISAPEDRYDEYTSALPAQSAITDVADIFIGPDAAQIRRNEEVIARLKALLEQIAPQYTVPGWVHSVTIRESGLSFSTTLPNGAPVPKKVVSETWERIDQQGFVVQRYVASNTGDPASGSVSIYDNGIVRVRGWINDTWEEEPAKADSGLSSLLNEMEREKEHAILNMEETTFEGQKVIAFSILYRQRIPVDMNPGLSPEEEREAGLIGAPIGSVYIHYYAPEKEYFVGMESKAFYPDGREELVSRITVPTVEYVEQPPDEILAYFGK